MTDPDRKIVYVNDIFERESGYTKEEVLGKDPKFLKSDAQDQQFFDEMNDKLNRGIQWEGEFINRHKNGSLYYEKASIVPIFLNDKLINYLAIKLNITKYVRQRQQLEQSAAVFDNTEDAIMITDGGNCIISVNRAFESMMGYREEEVLGKNPRILKSGKQSAYFYQSMWHSIMTIGVWKGKVYDRTKNGSIIPAWLTIKAVKDDKGEIGSFISIHTDLQDIIKTQERADFLAFHDSLTGLPNRINFEEHLAHLLKIASRNDTNVAVLFIDLDRFKVINDTLGHQVGDEMLKTVAQRIKRVLRDTDMLARIGGDEFVVILESITQQSDPAHVGKKILEAVKEPIKIGNTSLNTTASIGIALYPDDGLDGNTIIKHADSAMYHAKDLGKNNYQYYTEKLSYNVHQRLELEQALQTALRDNEFFLFYQPQYDLKTLEITGVEALLRWHSKTLGLISPAEFIPVAEDNGMIIKIGEFAFGTACKAFKRFKNAGLNLETIAVNVSSIQFREENLMERFLSITADAGISPGNIEIEITERYIMEYTTTNMTILEDFRNLGFKISIDDFGTGYSSMSYLKKMPLDTIKIDKSFINDIPEDNNDVEITKAIIVLSKSLGYSVVAEGIEKEEQENFLRKHNCDVGQGYHFSKPLGENDFIEFCTQYETEPGNSTV
jgi:diguanylate cyclase (GGDEF)-like protein/PAS domain S-box-containing protein